MVKWTIEKNKNYTILILNLLAPLMYVSLNLMLWKTYDRNLPKICSYNNNES